MEFVIGSVDTYQGLLMSLAPHDNAPAKHLVALGRFSVDDAMSTLVSRDSNDVPESDGGVYNAVA